MSTSIFSNPTLPSNYPGAVQPSLQSQTAPGFFTRKEVSRISTFTACQLSHLVDYGLKVRFDRGPNFHGRCCTAEQFYLILLVRELRLQAFSAEAIRRIIADVQKRPSGLPWEKGLCWLLTDGQTVHFIAEGNVVLALLLERRSPAFVFISLTRIQERMSLARPVQVALAAQRLTKVEPVRERRKGEWFRRAAAIKDLIERTKSLDCGESIQ